MLRKKSKPNGKYDDLILIDFNNFLFKFFYGFDKNLQKIASYTDSEHTVLGNETKLIKNIYNKIIKIKRKFSKSKMVICFDAPRNETWRHRMYSEYKQNRSGGNASDVDYTLYFEIFNQKRNDLLLLLSEVDDIHCVYVDKMEADDLIYLFTKKYSPKFHAVHILSNDGDLSQLHEFGNVHRYEKLVPQVKTINNPDWKLYMTEKIIKGDTGDNILNIGSYWVLNPKFVSFMINKVFDKKGKLLTEAEMIKKLEDIEKNNIELFNKYVTSYKFSDTSDKKIRKKKNKVKFSKKDISNLVSEKLDVDVYVKSKYDEDVQRNYRLNKKLVLFSQIPKFLLRKCSPHIFMKSNIDIDTSKKRMVHMVYETL